jgi:hypothetical protein
MVRQRVLYNSGWVCGICHERVWKRRLEETVAGLVRLGEFASRARPRVWEAQG